NGIVRTPLRVVSLSSATNRSRLVPVAASDFANDSVEGQRSRPDSVTRFDLLNVVGSRPARFASPDGDSPAWAASRSMPVQICACVSMDLCGCNSPPLVLAPLVLLAPLVPVFVSNAQFPMLTNLCGKSRDDDGAACFF